MKIKKQNLYLIGFILIIIIMFIGIWIVRINQNYYSAFITAKGDKSEAITQIEGSVYTSEDKELLKPWNEAVDSFRNSNLRDTVMMKASDGVDLSAYYYDLGADTTVIVLHSFNSDGNGDFYYAPYYAEKSYNLLFIDSRGFGNSEGDYIGYGYFEKNDLIDWIHYIIDLSGTNQKIIIHGEGMGAAAAIMAAGQEDISENVKFIVAQSVYSNIDDLSKYMLKEFFGLPSFPIMNLIENKMKKNAGYSCDEVNVTDYAKQATIPALFISGSADTVVPSEMSEQVYNAYVGEKNYLLIENAQHGTILAYGEESCTKTIDSFIDNYLD